MITINLKYESNSIFKAQENTNRIFNEFDFKNSMIKLFIEADKHRNHGIIQIYITVFNFAKKNIHTFNIFEYENDLKKEFLGDKIQDLREKFGVDIIKSANELK